LSSQKYKCIEKTRMNILKLINFNLIKEERKIIKCKIISKIIKNI
jgi:hypothetical protein